MNNDQKLSIAELGLAMDENRLEMLYQPQVTPDDGMIASVEALVRLRAPDGSLVPPSRFISVAERSGQIVELGRWAVRRACLDAAGFEGVRVGVNVSPMQFRDPGFVDFVAETAPAASLPFDRLELEITESAYFDDIAAAELEVERLRALGVHMALDDFGTGYASLTLLRRLRLDKIKIDKSFVAEIHRTDSAAIIVGVCAMARAMSLKVAAEGVETAEQSRFLRSAGCDYMQGHYYSKPLPAAEIAAISRSREPLPIVG